MGRWIDLLESAAEELRERADEYPDNFGPRGDYAGDVIAEIADGHVPVYYSDLWKLAGEEFNLLANDPELGPVENFSGAFGIIAANVYEAIKSHLWDVYREEIEGDAL